MLEIAVAILGSLNIALLTSVLYLTKKVQKLETQLVFISQQIEYSVKWKKKR